MKFIFQSIGEDDSKVTHEFEAETWGLALNEFVKFLMGSGFSLENNSIGINTNIHLGLTDDINLHRLTEFKE